MSTTTISFDFVRFSVKLLVRAHVSMLSISADRESALSAGMMRYVSSANLQSLLPRVRTSRSPALITYEAGPIPDPHMILAVMDFCVDI